MATATQIATRALKRLSVVAAGEAATAEEVADATEALTAMINSWEAEGLSGDVLPLDARFEQAVVAMLAVRLAPEYGRSVDPVLARDADAGWNQITGAFFAVPKSRFDPGLIYTGRYTSIGVILGQEFEDYADWQASTTYALRSHVENVGNIYECVTAGTSASSGGPTGTEAEITDGTVEWCFRRVAGA